MMRPPVIRAFHALPNELVVDNFAGGGGASTGIEEAIGRPVDIAINHSPEAIAMHRANHPETKHFCENILEVDPRAACGNQPVGLAWFSPDCRHFSKAKGTAPVSRQIRGLAWVVIRWAQAVNPRIIILENVEEFQTWGPLGPDGRPDPDRMGETFREWLGALARLGYAFEYKLLVAADYGTPTSRKRLFLIARRDGWPVVWPGATHGFGCRESWRPAADIIDWSLPCPSIFDRKRPLAEATLRRIARGVERYVVGAAEPFVIRTDMHKSHAGCAYPLEDPLRTITSSGGFALAQPFIVRHGHYSHKTGAGLRLGCGAGIFRGQRLEDPLSTVCATNDKHLVVPFITKHYGRQVGHDIRKTLGTVTAKDHHALTTALLINGRHGGRAAVRAFLKCYGSSDRACSEIVSIGGADYSIVDIGMRMLQPHELFAAQGFPDDYKIAPDYHGKPLTKTEQTKLAGNSVCPQVARAIVEQQVQL